MRETNGKNLEDGEIVIVRMMTRGDLRRHMSKMGAASARVGACQQNLAKARAVRMETLRRRKAQDERSKEGEGNGVSAADIRP